MKNKKLPASHIRKTRKTMPNTNPKTGIPYGTLYANSVPELWDDIFTNGTDLTFKEMREELKTSFKRRIDDITAEFSPDPNEIEESEARDQLANKIRDAIKDVIDDVCFRPEEKTEDLDVEGLVEAVIEKDELKDEDYETLLSELENDGLWDSGCDEGEHNYEHEYDTPDGKVHMLVQWLGGAPLIWVCESPWVARCRRCSPCVPGAGDLDRPDESGMVAYCLPPDDMPEGWGGKAWLVSEGEPEDAEEVDIEPGPPGNSGASLGESGSRA